jgi:adenylate kinase
LPLDIVILGPPGAGKGTQAKLISKDAAIPHVATGDMLRLAIANGTELGRKVREIVDRGELVSDELMVELIRERLNQPDTGDGFVLDGFPRTLPQAEALDRMLEEIERELSVALHFQIPDELAVERLHVRAMQEGRTDDAPEVARHRFDVYHRDTEPVTEYYRTRGILVGIHADRTIEEVFAEVQQVLQQAAAAAR